MCFKRCSKDIQTVQSHGMTHALRFKDYKMHIPSTSWWTNHLSTFRGFSAPTRNSPIGRPSVNRPAVLLRWSRNTDGQWSWGNPKGQSWWKAWKKPMEVWRNSIHFSWTYGVSTHFSKTYEVSTIFVDTRGFLFASFLTEAILVVASWRDGSCGDSIGQPFTSLPKCLLRFGVLGMFLGSRYLLTRCLEG